LDTVSFTHEVQLQLYAWLPTVNENLSVSSYSLADTRRGEGSVASVQALPVLLRGTGALHGRDVTGSEMVDKDRFAVIVGRLA
jgi:hypothetical protein